MSVKLADLLWGNHKVTYIAAQQDQVVCYSLVPENQTHSDALAMTFENLRYLSYVYMEMQAFPS